MVAGTTVVKAAFIGGGLNEKRVGAGAVRALEVIKLNNGDAGSGRRLEGGSVVNRRGWRCAELGVGCGCGEKERGADERGGNEGQGCGEARQNWAGNFVAREKTESEETMHSVWTAP